MDALDRKAFEAQLNALMPPGKAWQGELLQALLKVIAYALAELDARTVQLLRECFPNRTVLLIGDWERSVGLPDDCTTTTTTLSQRRGNVVERLERVDNLSPTTIVRIAAKWGLDITVSQLDQSRADAIQNLDTSGGKWRFVWWILVNDDTYSRFRTTSFVNSPLASGGANPEAVCRLKKLRPSHTKLIISYA